MRRVIWIVISCEQTARIHHHHHHRAAVIVFIRIFVIYVYVLYERRWTAVKNFIRLLLQWFSQLLRDINNGDDRTDDGVGVRTSKIVYKRSIDVNYIYKYFFFHPLSPKRNDNTYSNFRHSEQRVFDNDACVCFLCTKQKKICPARENHLHRSLLLPG